MTHKELANQILDGMDLNPPYHRYQIVGAMVKMAELASKGVVERGVKWLSDRIQINQEIETDENGSPYAKSYIDYMEKRFEAVKEITEDFRKAMMEE